MSRLYNLAVKQGGTLLENNNVYRMFSSKNGKKIIHQTIAPNGSYAINVTENGYLTKVINSSVISTKSKIIDTWDYKNNIGVNMAIAKAKEGATFLKRLFNKVTPKEVDPNGTITLHNAETTKIISTNIKLFGSTMLKRPNGGASWLVDEFIKYFK